MAADRSLPGSDLAFGAAKDEGQVAFLRFAILELATELPVGGVGFGGDEQAGGFQVEAVDNPGAIGAAAGRQSSGAVMEEGGGEGTGGPAGAGMNGDSGRFVQDDDIRILVQDVERDGLGLHMTGRGGRDLNGDGGTGGKQVAHLDRPVPGDHPTGLDPLLDFAA